MRHKPYQYIDPLVLFNAVGDDLESFRDLSKTFLKIAPPMFEHLEKAILAGDGQAVSHESHSLKGTALLVGAAQLARMLQDIESQSRSGEQHGIVPYIPEVTQLFKRVTQEVQESIVDFQGEAQHNSDFIDQA